MKKEVRSDSMGKSTKTTHAANLGVPVFGEVSVPIFQSSTFSFSSAEEGAARFSGERPGYIYSRMGNPTVRALEDAISSLEDGYRGIATATGMAAVTTVFLALLDRNAHLVSTDSVYGATRMVLEKEFSRFGVESSFVDTTNLDNITRALRPNTKVICIETPANPTMGITDIQGASRIAHSHNALLMVDNTFASPYLQRPLEHGADIVVHSLTKFVNGHSDVLGGMIVTKYEKVYQRIRSLLNLSGATMDPHPARCHYTGFAAGEESRECHEIGPVS
jgi:methionine-gamma-lyase